MFILPKQYLFMSEKKLKTKEKQKGKKYSPKPTHPETTTYDTFSCCLNVTLCTYIPSSIHGFATLRP